VGSTGSAKRRSSSIEFVEKFLKQGQQGRLAGLLLGQLDSFNRIASTFGEERAVFPVSFTAREAGRKEFAGELSFSVCNPQNCLLERREVRFAVDVR